MLNVAQKKQDPNIIPQTHLFISFTWLHIDSLASKCYIVHTTKLNWNLNYMILNIAIRIILYSNILSKV